MILHWYSDTRKWIKQREMICGQVNIGVIVLSWITHFAMPMHACTTWQAFFSFSLSSTVKPGIQTKKRGALWRSYLQKNLRPIRDFNRQCSRETRIHDRAELILICARSCMEIRFFVKAVAQCCNLFEVRKNQIASIAVGSTCQLMYR